MKCTLKLLFPSILLLFALTMNAQRGHHPQQHPKRGRTVVVKRSVYRPAKVRVFYPAWHPQQAYHHRWVYFPGKNIYWDNWRNHYVFWNGTVWISQPAPPPGLEKVELEKEKHRELPEKEDDVDDVYRSNKQHKDTLRDKNE